MLSIQRLGNTRKRSMIGKRRLETYLFRAKRARVLAGLLKAKQNLLDAGFKSPTRRCLSTALKTSAGRHAIEVVLKHIKAMHVGIDMLDITVCGAIPPYNGILGGKLVAMLLTSPRGRTGLRKEIRKLSQHHCFFHGRQTSHSKTEVSNVGDHKPIRSFVQSIQPA